MEAEDDFIVLVVDDNEKGKSSEQDFPTSQPIEICTEVDNIIETAQKYGEYISIKLDPEDDENQCDYLEKGIIKSETGSNYQLSLNEELKEEEIEQDNGDEEYSPDDEYDVSQPKKHRFSMLKPWEQKSFVAELREQQEELREDEDLLIDTLARIMQTVKPPSPPPGFYIKNGKMFECVRCGYLSDTLPAVTRHFHTKHGKRYLVCYACGVDFRCTGNLYKHEKRCIAPDAKIVLRARAMVCGRKGRGRPVPLNEFKRNKFLCSLCSAVFTTSSGLQSHENLHRGVRPYRCHVCPCAYTSNTALLRHTKQHADAQFICDHCGRSFRTRVALVSHMDTHKPIRKFGCEECNRRFAHKAPLVLHVNKEHRKLPPPCACPVCPKRFPKMYLLKAHMQRAHGLSIITRKKFFQTLPTMAI